MSAGSPIMPSALLGSLKTPPHWLLAKQDFIVTPAIPELTAVHNLTNLTVLGSWAGACVHKCCWILWSGQDSGIPMELAKPAAFLSIAVPLSVDWIGQNILSFYKNLHINPHLNLLIACSKVKKPECDLAQVSGTAVAAPCFCWVSACCSQCFGGW